MTYFGTSKIITDPQTLLRHIVQGKLQTSLPVPCGTFYTPSNDRYHPKRRPTGILYLLNGLGDFWVRGLIGNTKKPCIFHVLLEDTTELLSKHWIGSLPQELRYC